MKRVTIKDIASSLCLSVSTVSRALANDKNIHCDTRRRIFEEADRLGYRRNNYAAYLRSGRTNTIGVITHEMMTPYSASVLKGIQSIAHERNINIILLDSDNDVNLERANIEKMEQSMVDGLIISLCHGSDNLHLIEKLQQSGTPMVFYANIPAGVEVSMVTENYYRNALSLTTHLITTGRRKIAFIGGLDGIYSTDEAKRGYLEALHRAGIAPNEKLIVSVDATVAGGENAVDRILDRDEEIDAMLSCYELPAIGAMNHLREIGKPVPGEVAVASSVGTALSSMVNPKITTSEASLHDIGTNAAQLLLKKIENQDNTTEIVIAETCLQLRDSTYPMHVLQQEIT